jgi:hypothetical protein
MSKLTTDDLCGSLGYWRNRLKHHNEWDETENLSDDKAMVEIKRRLRAADALLEAAKEAVGECGLNETLAELADALKEIEHE